MPPCSMARVKLNIKPEDSRPERGKGASRLSDLKGSGSLFEWTYLRKGREKWPKTFSNFFSELVPKGVELVPKAMLFVSPSPYHWRTANPSMIRGG